MKGRTALRCCTCAALLMFADLARASEEGAHGAAHEPHGIPWATLLFTTVNFLLFVGVLGRYVWPAVKTWIRDRHASVVDELEAAARAREEAEQLRRQWQVRMDSLEADLEALRSQAQLDLANERERIISSAMKAADSIRRDAERAAAAEVRRVQEQVRAELVRTAVHLATDITRKGWSDDDQQRAVADFLKQVH